MSGKFTKNLFIIVGITALCAMGGCQNSSSPTQLLGELFGNTGHIPTPTQAAQQAFNTKNPDLRRRAVILFSDAPFGGAEPYVKMYRLLITDPNSAVRAACAKALGKHGTPQDAIEISKLLDDKNAFTRWQAAKALQKLHNPNVVDKLADTLEKDDDADVRMACAKALGQYAQVKVFLALVGALADKNYGVVAQAENSLITLTGYKKAGDDGANWLRWENKHGQDIFQNREQYTYTPYDAPPGFFRSLQFWRAQEHPKPKIPKGMSTNTGTKS